MKRWRIHDEAIAEIDATVDWYELQRDGLGREFLDDLRATVAKLRSDPTLSTPDRFAPPDVTVRRRLLRRFPYLVVFAESTMEYVVLAVMHRHRRPGYWSSRMADSK